MTTLPRLSKTLGILLILLLLVPFVLGAAAEVAPRYVGVLLPIFLVVIAFGIVFYYISKHKRPRARKDMIRLAAEL